MALQQQSSNTIAGLSDDAPVPREPSLQELNSRLVVTQQKHQGDQFATSVALMQPDGTVQAMPDSICPIFSSAPMDKEMKSVMAYTGPVSLFQVGDK